MSASCINISGIDKVDLLAALWGARSPASFFTHSDISPPGFNRAGAALAVTRYIDYFCGRCIKADLSGNTVDPWLYDRDAAPGTFQRIVDGMRASSNNDDIKEASPDKATPSVDDAAAATPSVDDAAVATPSVDDAAVATPPGGLSLS